MESCTSCFSTEDKKFYVRAGKNISEHVFIVTAGYYSGFTGDMLHSASIQINPNIHFLCLCWCKFAVWPKTQEVSPKQAQLSPTYLCMCTYSGTKRATESGIAEC